jgi:hypothetical protein
MICWILDKDFETYKDLCLEENTKPQVLERTLDKVHVIMPQNIASTWNLCGYWYEMG